MKLSVSKLLLFCVFLQYFSYFMYLTKYDYIFLFLYFCMSLIILVGVVLYTKARFHLRFIYGLLCVLGLLFVGAYFSNEYPFYIGVYNILYAVSSLCSAYVIFISKNIYRKASLLFVLFSLFVLFKIVTLGLGNPDAYNNIFENGSRNYVSAILIFFLSLLILIYDKDRKEISFFYPFFTLLLSVLLYGRSGIVITFILVLFIVFRGKILSLKYFTIIILSLLIPVIIIYFGESSSFAEHGVDSGRFKMLEQYFDGIGSNYSELFFGRNVEDCCVTIAIFEGNPHNSFIMGHIRYGIVHTILSLIVMLYIFSSRYWVYIFCGLVFYIRISLDLLGLFTPFDIVLYYILFLAFDKKAHSKKLDKREL